MRSLARALSLLLLALALGASLAPIAGARPGAQPFPAVIPLPDDWQAEGIAIGRGTTAYAGSLGTGAIAQVDLRTGARRIVVEPHDGVAVGLKYAHGRLYVAGGPTGLGSVYDARTGELIAACTLGTPGATFVNDVVVTRGAAYFTDSAQPLLYRLPITRRGVDCADVERVALGGEWMQGGPFNANGIAATPDGRGLLVMNSSLAAVYLVDPGSGDARRIRSDPLPNGDGILLRGRELVVVQNRLNQIAVLRLSSDLSSARLVSTLQDPDFAVPTTVAALGNTLYVVNARFGTTPPPPVPYEIVKVDGR